MKFILLFSALGLLKEYVLWLYGQVIETQEVLKGSVKILYVKHLTVQQKTGFYIIHSVTDYTCRNLQTFSSLAKLVLESLPGQKYGFWGIL